jgi:membrane protease subunit HflC
MRWLIVATGLLVWLRTCLVPADFADFTYVTRFGRPVAVLDGESDAGLHLKAPWPIDSVRRIDRRVHLFDLPPVEVLTRDAADGRVDKSLTVDAVVTWRVPDAEAADTFVRTVGTPDAARKLLAPRIAGRLAAVVGSRPLESLAAVADPPAVADRAARLRAELLADDAGRPLADQLRAEYGVELVDLRVRRFGYPEAVRAGIADRIRSERARKAAEYEADGRRRAADILSRADRDARTVEAEAKAAAVRLAGQADADADRLRAEAFARDREFYAFLQKLKTYQTLLAESRDVLLVSTRHPLFDLLLGPPGAKP